MPRGGKRPGGGRPRGSKTKKRSGNAKQVAASGKPLPLDIITEEMHAAYDKGDHDKAVSLAVIAAPYYHAKKASVTVKGDGPGGVIPLGLRFVTSQELEETGDDGADEARP